MTPSLACTKLTAIFLFLTCLLPQLTFAMESYRQGDKLYVAPTSGVNIRTRPSLQAPVLAKLPYNTIVTVLADSLPAEPLQVKVSDFSGGFLTLHGGWIKVKAGNSTGYAFDGMLSRFKGLALGVLQDEPYYAATFGTPAEKVIPKTEVVEGHKVDYETVVKTYPKGIVEEYTLFDSCHNLKYTFSFPFNEAYWLIERMLLHGDAVQDVEISKDGSETVLTWYSCT
ncbi:SH3 domain-containing protein [Pontibacter litorisediminis]|uniref:SH3 domain-containing protein n=1 Tax=Pontibacter litorisediminis TaxID=1846260 RepID=UPI0023EBA91A|nr:SH3 domain-containing protein [Pontibacter litorisediminis]